MEFNSRINKLFYYPLGRNKEEAKPSSWGENDWELGEVEDDMSLREEEKATKKNKDNNRAFYNSLQRRNEFAIFKILESTRTGRKK